ncbi:helix-turn-helix domain-containing protein [Coprococcus sp. TF11-13]|uniref:helix-turn-helix domain-containing protein n=1 Tax=Coprococcus sp. TF11-13 TaxID=2293096 RepID=UPI001FAA1615|nr:helix-turn-helix transcriptional regulator [Coprococcus sp. TF11-13]
METKDVILELRTKRGLSQDDLAEKVMVTRQAVSRWENGETVPNTDTLKLLSSWNVNLAETDALEFWRIWILF